MSVFNNINFCALKAFSAFLIAALILASFSLNAQTAPQLVSAECLSSSEIRLTWQYPGCDSMELHRGSNINGPYTVVSTFFSSSQTTLTDGGVDLITSDYFYFLKCMGNSATSDTLSVLRIGDPPPFKYVTVLPDGSILIVWEQSANPGVAGYFIYEYFENINGPGGIFIDTLFGISSTSYVDTTHNAGQGAVYYTLTAFNNCGLESPINLLPHRTVFLSDPQFDDCDKEIDLTWTRYINWEGQVTYKVFVNKNNSGWQAVSGSLTDTTFSYGDFQNGDSLAVKIEAYNQRGDTSVSNRQGIKIDYTEIDEAVILIKVSVPFQKDQIELRWRQADSAAVIKQYSIYRKTGANPFEKIGSTTGKSFIDKNVSPHSYSYQYKIVAADECDNTEESNIGNSILLQVSQEPDYVNKLSWNRYNLNLDENVTYTLYREVAGENPEAIETFTSAPQVYEDDVFQIAEAVSGAFKYFIIAEYTVSAGTQILNETAYSNVAEIVRSPEIFIPNALNPTSAQPENRFFKPVLVFEDETQGYIMMIFNRWGEKIFETQSPAQGWDGLCGSDYCPSGVYVYSIQYTGTNGVEEGPIRGTVTLIR